jgi:hypothetical protein
MFPVNTIIAWYINIYHKNEDMIITTLLLPLGHISNSARAGLWLGALDRGDQGEPIGGGAAI